MSPILSFESARLIARCSASLGSSGNFTLFECPEIIGLQHSHFMVSGLILRVAIMLGNRLAKSSSNTSLCTPGSGSRYKPPRSDITISRPVLISSALFFFQGTSTPSFIDWSICIADIAEPGDSLDKS